MQHETKKRSILKAFSWRVWATVTTAVIVLIFTGQFALAITVGFMEVFAKMALYFFHERMWHRISWGKEEVPSFVLWFTGLPASGKSALADYVYEKLVEEKLKVDRIDSVDVRPLFPETGFTPDEVNSHIERVGHLCAMLEQNGVIAVASFVSPYRKSRDFARKQAKNFVEIYMKTTPEACAGRDSKGLYQKARAGELDNFPGVHTQYEPSPAPQLTIDADNTSIDEAGEQIMVWLRKNVMRPEAPKKLRLRKE